MPDHFPTAISCRVVQQEDTGLWTPTRWCDSIPGSHFLSAPAGARAARLVHIETVRGANPRRATLSFSARPVAQKQSARPITARPWSVTTLDDHFDFFAAHAQKAGRLFRKQDERVQVPGVPHFFGPQTLAVMYPTFNRTNRAQLPGGPQLSQRWVTETD